MGNIDAVPADILEPFDYGALGHIHKPMKAGGGILPLLRHAPGLFCQ